ncbi:MAG: VOC family protein [Gammaproteobacteria bacterium]|nr:VOC family protein [Pseudomonadales bacterium]MCP5348059.1 VOC family protein [Pseudomonadales bacterium]
MNKFVRTLILLSLGWAPLTFAQLAVPSAEGLTYGHVHLNVSDVALHQKLWVELFDAEVVSKGPLTAIKFPNMIILLRENPPTMGSRQTVMDHFGFKVRNIETFLARWRAAGYPVESEFIGSEGQKNAYVMMPDDVYVELQEDQSLHVEVMGYHVHYFTDQYQELLQWYTRVFDLETRPRGRIETTTNVPGMNLSFGNSRTPRVGTQGAAIDHIGFEVDDLEAFVARLAAKGIELDSPIREIPAIGLKIAFLTDPQGVYIELTEGLDDY